MGGVVAAIEQGFFQKRDLRHRLRLRQAQGERRPTGDRRQQVRRRREDQKIEVHKLDPESEARQIRRLKQVRRHGDPQRAQAALDKLLAVARDESANLMPATIEAVRAHLSMGEITGALREVFGSYTETPVF